ncbi:ABC transporter substrate-binding protein [Peptoniphilus equinus]|uniref:ABC transporter substrate-binding protein n=1 Tax=Peptoniphilus equinus TaxID=3016343 RepID=A0ABY7QUI3_9FIRM|nr:ABC transporter substrate-binding protein [Peptoniphilus equinus]WBW49935.1 ABC transporter substrate-binding protein [Peptoniphilus equinus]
MKKRIWMSVALMLVLVLTACGKADNTASKNVATNDAAATESTSGSKDTFTMVLGGDPGTSVNSLTTQDRYGLTTLNMIYSPLYSTQNDGTHYFLAESMDASEDGMVYTAKLRQNVTWHDGTPFTADDVIFTMNAVLDEANNAAQRQQLLFNGEPVKIDKVDDYTVTFTLPEFSASAKEMFGGIYIMPKHIYENVDSIEKSEINMTAPVGTGPYKLAKYTPGQSVEFTANTDYFLGAPKIQNVVFRIIEKAATAKIALQKGEVDLHTILPSDIADLEGSNISHESYDEGRVAYVKIHTWGNNMDNIDFRKAIFYALNKDEIMKAAFQDPENYTTTETFLPAANPYYNDKVTNYTQDLTKSKEHLEASGVQNPTVRLAYISSDDAQTKEALVIQAQLQAAGITTELVGITNEAYNDVSTKKGDTTADMILGGYIMGIDPNSFLPLFDATEQGWMHMEDAEIDALFHQANVEKDPQKRQELYGDVQQKIQDTAIFYPLGGNKRIVGYTPSLSGLEDAKLVPVFTFEDMSKLFFQ